MLASTRIDPSSILQSDTPIYSIFAFTARYAVKPADAERYPQAGNFKPAESGEEGYYTYSLQYLMQRLGDTWRCVNTGTSASGLLEDYERKNGLL